MDLLLIGGKNGDLIYKTSSIVYTMSPSMKHRVRTPRLAESFKRHVEVCITEQSQVVRTIQALRCGTPFEMSNISQHYVFVMIGQGRAHEAHAEGGLTHSKAAMNP